MITFFVILFAILFTLTPVAVGMILYSLASKDLDSDPAYLRIKRKRDFHARESAKTQKEIRQLERKIARMEAELN